MKSIHHFFIHSKKQGADHNLIQVNFELDIDNDIDQIHKDARDKAKATIERERSKFDGPNKSSLPCEMATHDDNPPLELTRAVETSVDPAPVEEMGASLRLIKKVRL